MRPDRRSVLCLITDRRRLAQAVGEPESAWEPLLLSQIEGAIRGGVDVIQIRERDLDAGVLAGFVRRCLAAAAGSSARIVVNDRLDVAIAAGADGVHLREDSVSTLAARRLLGASPLLGRSVHSPHGAVAAGQVDYLIAGSVFATVSKPGVPARLGLDGLQAVVKRAAPRGVWAVGGITAERLAQVTRTGAEGVAAISAFIPSCSASRLATTVQNLTADLRFCFDSRDGRP